MSPWPKHPVIYEINTWVWLGELSRKYQKPVTSRHGSGAGVGRHRRARLRRRLVHGRLGAQPGRDRDLHAQPGAPRGFPASAAGLRGAGQCRLALLRAPLCCRRASRRTGRGWPQPEELSHSAAFVWSSISSRTMSPRITRGSSEHPEYFIQGERRRREQRPGVVRRGMAARCFACGRDPFFPAWPDVLQLNAFQPGLRQAVIDTLAEHRRRSATASAATWPCCVLNNIFERTWGARAGAQPVERLLDDGHPGDQGEAAAISGSSPRPTGTSSGSCSSRASTHCYDKKLYDRMEHGDAESVRLHLLADLALPGGDGPVHREPRRAAGGRQRFRTEKGAPPRWRSSRSPGPGCCTRGSSRARKVRLPVFLGRRPAEPVDRGPRGLLRTPAEGDQSRCLPQRRSGASANAAAGPTTRAAGIFSPGAGSRTTSATSSSSISRQDAAQARVQVPWDELRGKTWRLNDVLSGETYDRSGDEMRDAGLYVDLGPWQCNLFQVRAV
ncbi:MAG: hypothetical protein M0C28_30885 [Candidatus Moduliflexus flocculans]|nr:hypothetical protein [Candidatus Moduliflexus flocculans]